MEATRANVFTVKLMLFGILFLFMGQAMAITQLESEFLEAHNAVRAGEGVPPLEWDEQVASFARYWASTLQKQGCSLTHSSGSGYGENLWTGQGGPEVAVEDWVQSAGHYANLVSPSYKKLGCAYVRCGSRALAVCNYYSGNELVVSESEQGGLALPE